MNITFVPLVKSHFLLLIKWLQTAHVRLWWDQDIKWTPELIEKKYGDYVNGSKSVNKSHGEFKKPIYAYIIYIDNPCTHIRRILKNGVRIYISMDLIPPYFYRVIVNTNIIIARATLKF